MKISGAARGGALVVALLLAGCKGDPGAEVKSEANTNGTSGALSTAQAPKATAAAPAKAGGETAAPTPAATAQTGAAATAASPTLAAPGAGQEAPAIPEGTSAPPSVDEWKAAASANTVGPNSAPRDCELKVVREWLKVNCTGKIKEITNMDGFGTKNVDYFELVTIGKVADFVVRLKKGKALKMRIIREDQSASLFVNWPTQSAKPSIIALQIYNPS